MAGGEKAVVPKRDEGRIAAANDRECDKPLDK
jgi:hypothetical protein